MKSRLLYALLLLGLVSLPLRASFGGGGSVLSAKTDTASEILDVVVETAADDDDGSDPNAIFISNDTVATAQSLPNPVVLTGYVNQPGSGFEGRSRVAGDLVDVYRVGLKAGDRVTLTIAGDGVQADLDLGLADLGGNLLDASAGQVRIESLTVKTAGDYLVLVGAHQGASRYELTIGPAREPAAASLRLSDSFAVGQSVVRFPDQRAEVQGGVRARVQALGGFAGREHETQQRNVLFDLAGLKQVAAYRALASTESSPFPGGFQPADSVARDKLKTLYQVKAMRLDPEVAAAGLNYIRKPFFVPNDPYYQYQWHYPQINLPQAWNVTTGAGVIVAVIDTGVALDHPDLQGQFVAGYDFIKDPAVAGDGDGIDSNPDDPGDHSGDDGSSSFHGTHVTGTVVAATNNGSGVAGVAFGAKVMPLRALGIGGGYDYDIEQAIRFAAGLTNDSGTVPPRRADVISMSLGGTGFSSGLQDACNQARAAGVVLVAAAGNDGTTEMNYPAAFPGVIAVGAVDINKARAPYSNFGSWVSVVAPGGNMAQDVNGDGYPDGVVSTAASDSTGKRVDGYGIAVGTSMATPHMAGVVALMKAVAPSLTPQKVADLLTSGALTDDLGTPGKDDQFGYGLINASKAVAAAGGGSGSGSFQTIDPSLQNFGVNVGTMVPVQ
ncbi:MAG: S8 family peptidase [Candidatus Contendobacter sp.]|nr:S8 family peptidase [Candidatus Contendobacter sp.]MDS4060043.1 S8 family peptidase [Candidatus Contendobacter sp.]